MAGFRPERVAQLLQEAITEMLQRGHIKDPRVGQATVAEVKVTTDLRIAKVYVQAIGGAKEREDTVKGLQNAEGFIRRELRPMLSLKSVPQLLFRADETAEKADRVLGLLAQLNQQKPATLTPVPVEEEEPADDDIVESDELEASEEPESEGEEAEGEEPGAEEPAYIHESDFEEPETKPVLAKTPVKATAAKPKAKAKAAAKPKAKAKASAKPKAKAKSAKKPARKTAKKTAAKKPAKKLTKK